MSTMMADITPEQYRATLAEIDNLKRGHMPAGTDIIASGEGPLWQAGSRLLISTLLQSLYIAMPLVFVITGIAFRSFRFGALSVLPNVLPITVALGLLAPLDISLRFSTIVAFPLAFGLAIDDTIHFLARYRSEISRGKSNDEAVRTAITTTGRAMLLTSLLLIVGFVVFFFSNFLGVVHVAALLWIILSTALLGDLVLLPAMMLVFPPRLRQEPAR
jgi:predicted RND superfamily exporter protein